MSRRPAARDIRMLTDVRDQLRAQLSNDLPRPLTREQERMLGYRPAATPINCNHGVPWTECTTCSKARAR